MSEMLYNCVFTHDKTGAKITLPPVSAKSLDDLKAAHGAAADAAGLMEFLNKGLKDRTWSVKFNKMW